MKNKRYDMKKWQVYYVSKDGSFGIVGYILFNAKEDAELWAKKFKMENEYVAKTMLEHPSLIYSKY